MTLVPKRPMSALSACFVLTLHPCIVKMSFRFETQDLQQGYTLDAKLQQNYVDMRVTIRRNSKILSGSTVFDNSSLWQLMLLLINLYACIKLNPL